mgnify:CR=1 FL=1
MCLDIIANAPGRERPGIKTFLETGSKGLETPTCCLLMPEPEAPARKDIPVGLQNIGNTCYLNSILQVSRPYSVAMPNAHGSICIPSSHCEMLCFLSNKGPWEVELLSSPRLKDPDDVRFPRDLLVS